MTSLQPIMAARLADAVYGIRTRDNVERGVTGRMGGPLTDSLKQSWKLRDGVIAQGSSGLVKPKNSGFALVLQGQDGGAHRGEWAVLVRGTQTLADWASNANVTFSAGPGGLPVHAGFLGIYDTITDTIKSSLPPRGKVHLVGHSLGGALANLLAVQLSMSRGYDVELYTFGAPRVGGRNFSTILESRVGTTNMHRVYDVADPVPLVPVFPYLHAPGAGGIKVGTSSLLINPDNHDMKNNYTRLVDGKVWSSLEAASRDVVRYTNLDDLLGMASIHSSIPGGSMGLWVLGKALQALLDVAVLITGGVLYAADSLLDKLALLLMNAARLSAELAGKILNFMTMVLKWAGRAASSAAEMTARFLSWVLGLLLSPIANLCNRALNRLG